jgi:UDP-N-acetylglucosamine pyrophosphorylase
MPLSPFSNSGDLGTRMDASPVGIFAKRDIPFMMGVTEKTPAGVRGGHLAKLKKSKNFILQEVAQILKGQIEAF